MNVILLQDAKHYFMKYTKYELEVQPFFTNISNINTVCAYRFWYYWITNHFKH